MRKIAIAALMIAASAAAPCAIAHADTNPPGLERFVGTWFGMGEHVVIDADGSGSAEYRDFNACPDCAMYNVPRETTQFVLTNVSSTTATGLITSDTGQGNHFGAVTVRFSPARSGYTGPTITLTLSGKSRAFSGAGTYCAVANAIECGNG